MTEPTPREFDRWIASVDRLTEVLEELPEKLRAEMAVTYVRKDVHKEQRELDQKAVEVLAGKVATHASWFQWAGRLIGGVIILALLAGVIAQNGAPGL